MTAIDNSLTPTRTRPVSSGEFFLGSLKKRWRDYRKELKRCRKRISEERVHDVRIAIRRLLATLSLIASVLPPGKVFRARNQLKKRLKMFAQLRDIHAQMVFIQSFVKSSPAVREYRHALEKRELRGNQRLQRRLSRTEDELLVAAIARLKDQLRTVAQEATSESHRISAVTTAFRAAFVKVSKRHQAIRPAETATIHRARVAFKKFRYMTEALRPLLPGVTRRKLNAMRGYQARMGDIQDLEVLLHDLEKFIAKKGKEGRPWDHLIAKLQRRRSFLIRRFIRSMGRLNNFASVESVRITLSGSI